MADEQEYEAALRTAARELDAAATAADVRRVWRSYVGVLGHRALGRLLLGRPAEELLARRAGRDQDG